MGLNDAYEQTRRHILMLKSIQMIDEVFNMVSQEERQKNLKPSVKTESIVFQMIVVPEAANNGFYNGPMENAAYSAQYCPYNKMMCTHCGRSGHTYQKCYKLNDYPSGHKLSTSQTRGNSQSGTRPSQSSQGSQNYYQKNADVAKDVTSLPVNTLDLSKFRFEQVQSLINQLTSHARLPVTKASHAMAASSPSTLPTATIIAQGYMDPQSSSELDDW
ncbi:hypothetical protein N665_2740s0002 [Sinapis alba]|nr:hypothetical protein N665_2740s0002 [Sinapis alba]